jgi:hypothetical protein
MLEIVAESDKEAHGEAGGCPFVATIPVESTHRIVMPRRSAESRFAPRQYCYAASKSGVVPSLHLTASGVSQRNESSNGQCGDAV